MDIEIAVLFMVGEVMIKEITSHSTHLECKDGIIKADLG